MSRTIYRYRFGPQVQHREVEQTLRVAAVAVEGLYSTAAMNMDVCWCLSQVWRVCTIDASSDVGRDLSLIFTNFLIRQFGRESFEVEALTPSCPGPTTENAA
jgi:hypothetical protein